MLLLVVEKLSTTQRMRQLRFHSAAGNLVGQLILDGGMVSCGVWVDGCIYIDDEFRRDAAPISSILSKLLLGEPTSFEETARVQAIPLVARRALCQVTARALRQLSVLCDLAQIRITELPGPTGDGRGRSGSASAMGGGTLSSSGSSAGQSLRFFFSPVDLLLAAGRSGRFREADAAAKIYEMHPEPVEERWLFQWQGSQIGEAWPVMTTRQSDKQTNSVAQFGLLGQSLVQRFAMAQRSGTLRGTAAELAATDDHLYYVVLTDRYVTLLVYQKQQLERVLRSFQDLVFDTPHQVSTTGAPVPVQLPAPAPSMAMAASPAQVAAAVAAPAPAALPASPPLASSSPPPAAPPVVAAAETSAPPAAAGAVPKAGSALETAPAALPAQPALPSSPVSLEAPTPDTLPRASAVTLGELLAESEPGLVAQRTEPEAAVLRVGPASLAALPQPAAAASVVAAAPAVVAPAVVAPAAVASVEAAPVAVAPVAVASVAVAPVAVAPVAVVPALVAPETAKLANAASPPDRGAAARDAAVAPGAGETPRPSEPGPVASPAAAEATPAGSGLALLETVLRPAPASLTHVEPPPTPVPVQGTRTPAALAEPRVAATSLTAVRPAGEVPPASLVSPAVPAPRPLLESELRPAQAAPAVRVPAANREPARRVAPSPPPKLEVIAEPSPAGSPVLRIQGLSAECERRQILQGIDLELAPRGLYALIGGSGAGKSALLGVLSGRHRAASGWSLTGSIWYCNLPLGATTRPAVLGAEVTRASLSLRGYLLADLDEGMADRFSTPLLLQLLERVSLSALAPYLSETLGGPRLRLSTGEWRRLAIARELAASPPLLCLDDAFVGLSEDDSEVLWSVLQSQARERAVLYSEQQPPRVGLPLSQVFCLQNGQLRQMGLAGEPSAAAAESSAKAPEKPPTEPAVSSAPAGSGVAPVSPASGAASPAETSQGTTGLEAPRLRPAAARPVSKGTDGVIWASTAPILRLRNFGIVVNGRPQLANINLDLPDCGLHLLVGRDGPQRRMLLRALCGLHGGQLQLIGDALFGGGALSEEHGLGCLSPNPRLSLLTVREHLVHGPTLWQGGARHERGQRALRLLEQSGFPELESLLDQPLCDLGTYERRVVEILAPLSASPLALALHDVVAGVDAARRPRLLRLLADQAARRAILLFTDEPQPYLAFAFTPPARQAWLTGDHIVADEPG